MFVLNCLRYVLNAFSPTRLLATTKLMIANPDLGIAFLSQVSFAIRTIILIHDYAPRAEIKSACLTSISWGIVGIVIIVRKYGLRVLS